MLREQRMSDEFCLTTSEEAFKVTLELLLKEGEGFRRWMLNTGQLSSENNTERWGDRWVDLWKACGQRAVLGH